MKKLNENMLAGGMIGGGLDNTASPVSYTVQGGNPGYTYAVHPLTDDLQMKPSQMDNQHYIHIGCTVRGCGVNNPSRHYTGQIIGFVRDSAGKINFIKIKTIRTNKFVHIMNDDNLELLLFNPNNNEQNTNFKISPNNNIKLNR